MQNKTNAAPETGAPKDMPLRDSEEQTYAVNVDGQTMELTLDQLIAAAEQGLSKANAAAYRVYELHKLRKELEELKKNAENRKLDVGSARSDGENNITDPIILALMGKG